MREGGLRIQDTYVLFYSLHGLESPEGNMLRSPARRGPWEVGAGGAGEDQSPQGAGSRLHGAGGRGVVSGPPEALAEVSLPQDCEFVLPQTPKPHPSLTTSRATTCPPAPKPPATVGGQESVLLLRGLRAERPPPGTCREPGRKTPAQAATHGRSGTAVFSARGCGVVWTGSGGTFPTQGPSSTPTLQRRAQPQEAVRMQACPEASESLAASQRGRGMPSPCWGNSIH